MNSALEVAGLVVLVVVWALAMGFGTAARDFGLRLKARRAARRAAESAPPPESARPVTRTSTGDRELDEMFTQAEREGAVAAAWVVVEDDGVLITFRRFDAMRSAALPEEVGNSVGRAVAEAVAEAQTPGGRVISD